MLIASIALDGMARGASAGTGMFAARSDLMRLQVRLSRAALADPAIATARDESSKASALLNQVRQNILGRLYETADYADLRAALWGKQRELEGEYVQIPSRIQAIVSNAKDALSLRARMTALETQALNADDVYVQAKDDANLKLGLYQKVRKDALDSVRSDPQFVAAMQQLRSMSQSMTGWRLNAIAAAQ